MKLTNKNAEKLVKALQDAAPEFDNRNKNRIFRSILFGIAEAFPEDKHKIFAEFKSSKAKAIPTGGAKITRKSDEIVQKKTGSGCEGCGSGETRQVAASDPTVTPGKKQPQETDISKFTTTEAVLDAFKGRASAIIAFGQSIGVPIPASVTRAKTAAKYIVAEAKEQNQEEE